MLRGDKTIRARLRSVSGSSLNAAEQSGDADGGDIDQSMSGASQTSSHGLLPSATGDVSNSLEHLSHLSAGNSSMSDQTRSNLWGSGSAPSREEAVRSSTHGKLRF